MPDKYWSFVELSAGEEDGSYHIEKRLAGTVVALIAPHAGKIEIGTSELCRAVACDDLTYYIFEGRKARKNSDLHITSSRFDEPQGIKVAQSARVVVSFHGQSGDAKFVNVGGLADDLCALMIERFVAAGFAASRHKNHKLQGRDPNNICNRGSSGRGLQLEISRGLREELIADDRAMAHFVATVRSTLDDL